MHTNWAREGVRGHSAMTRIVVIQNSICHCLSALHLWDLHALVCGSGRMPPTEGGPSPVKISKTSSVTVTFSKRILELQCHKATSAFHLVLPTPPSPQPPIRGCHFARLENVAQTAARTQTPRFPYRCRQLAGAPGMLWAGMNWGRTPRQGWCPWFDGKCCCLAMASGS